MTILLPRERQLVAQMWWAHEGTNFHRSCVVRSLPSHIHCKTAAPNRTNLVPRRRDSAAVSQRRLSVLSADDPFHILTSHVSSSNRQNSDRHSEIKLSLSMWTFEYHSFASLKHNVVSDKCLNWVPSAQGYWHSLGSQAEGF